MNKVESRTTATEGQFPSIQKIAERGFDLFQNKGGEYADYARKLHYTLNLAAQDLVASHSDSIALFKHLMGEVLFDDKVDLDKVFKIIRDVNGLRIDPVRDDDRKKSAIEVLNQTLVVEAIVSRFPEATIESKQRTEHYLALLDASM